MCQGFLSHPIFEVAIMFFVSFDVAEFLTNDVEDCKVAATIYFNLNK